MACGFIAELTRHGIRGPDEVSVVGFDGIELAAHLSPPLTTIRQPRREIGRRGAEAILSLIEGEALPERTVVRPESGETPVRMTA